MKKLLLSTFLVGVALTSAAQAEPTRQSPWQVRGRIIDVITQEDSTTSIGGDVDVSSRAAPELDISYFFTDNISAELVLATTKHTMKHSSGTDIGSAYILPPTLTAQYHFTPDQKFSPYLGAGLNYSLFYNEDPSAAFTDLEMDGGVGYALQAGFDYWFDDHWGANVDFKKIFLNVDAKLNNGAVTADVDLDPMIIGTGVSYRF